MIMEILQWAGSGLIIAGYWYMLRFPIASCLCTITGCVLTGIWASLLQPVGYGVIALELFVTVMASMNLGTLLTKK